MAGKADMKTGGTHRGGCPRLMEMSLKNENGVASVAAEYPAGEASVEYDPVEIAIGGSRISSAGSGTSSTFTGDNSDPIPYYNT